jgi:hypothetical protein
MDNNAEEVEIVEDDTPPTEDPKVSEAPAKSTNKHEPAPGSPRWNQVYYENKQLKRDIEDVKAMTAQLISDSNNKRIQEEINDLDALRRQAMEQGDYNEESKLNKQIIERVAKVQNTPEVPPKAVASAPVAETLPPETEPETIAFISRNLDWWKKDIAMTNTAIQYEQQLCQDPAWSGKEHSAILSEVEKYIKRDFPHKFPKTELPEPTVSPPGGAVHQATSRVQVSRREIQEFRARTGMSFSDNEIAKQIRKRKEAKNG